MNTSEESKMLELCELEMDDLKPKEDSNIPVPPEPDPVLKSETKNSDEDTEKNLLYDSLGLDLKNPKIATYMRLDTIHIFGVDDMSTKAVYEFFEPFKPMTLEWINDSSCNAVWPDEKTAAKVMLQLSQPVDEKMQTDVPKQEIEPGEITEEKENAKDSNQIVVVEEDDESDSEEEGECREKTLSWRVAAGGKDKSLKLRFATWDDRKVRGAEKYSEYYKKHGNPNFGGLKGLISSSRKRRYRENVVSKEHSEEEITEEPEIHKDKYTRLRVSSVVSDLYSEKPKKSGTSSKRPKMKMYADEEERKTHKIRSGKVSNRLGSITVDFSMDRRVERNEEFEEENEEEEERGYDYHDYDELELSSPQEFGSKSVWDRLQVEVPNTRYTSTDHKRSHRTSVHETHDHSSGRDLRRKLQRIRYNKKDHRSPLLIGATTK